MIRAKMKCVTVLQFEAGETVELAAVTNEENKVWAKHTPAGKAVLTINNGDALGRFKPGKEYFIDFTESPEK